jgi:hypothetical protein
MKALDPLRVVNENDLTLEEQALVDSIDISKLSAEDMQLLDSVVIVDENGKEIR